MTLLVIKYFARNAHMLIVKNVVTKINAMNVTTILLLLMESVYFPLCQLNTVIANKIRSITKKVINITLTKSKPF